VSNEENHIDPLDNPEMKKNIFEVPDGYFEQFEANLEARLDTQGEEIELSKHLKEPVFEVPEGYFDQLQDKIKAKLAEESSLLSKEEKLKIPPFEAPEGYFEGFEGKLQEKLAKNHEQDTAKVVPMYQKNWFRLAVAAVLVMGFFILSPTDPPFPPTGELSEETMLAYLSESDFDLDLIASLDGFDTVIDQILEEETLDYDFDLGLNPELEYELEYLER